MPPEITKADRERAIAVCKSVPQALFVGTPAALISAIALAIAEEREKVRAEGQADSRREVLKEAADTIWEEYEKVLGPVCFPNPVPHQAEAGLYCAHQAICALIVKHDAAMQAEEPDDAGS